MSLPHWSRWWLALLPAVIPLSLSAATHPVQTLSELVKKLESGVEPGDTIVLKDGVHAATAPIAVRAVGAPGKPITITAQSIGGAEITGAGGFVFSEPAAHVVIAGFKFTHAGGKNLINAGTSHIRYSRNVFQCTGDGHYLVVMGDHAEVDYNEFAAKKTAGNMLAVGGSAVQVARKLWVHHNYFHDYAPASGTSTDMLRMGLNALAHSVGEALVEHNLFARCRGDNDMLSSRSSGNTYRYNTFVDSPTCQLTLRHGHDCQVYGNYLRDTEGIRIYGDRHKVFSNYLQDNYFGINMGNGSPEPENAPAGSGFDRPDDCIIVFNTMVSNRTHYQMSRRAPEAFGATRIVFANNLVVGGEMAVKIEGPYVDPVWSGNVLWSTDPGGMPKEGFVEAEPKLKDGPDGAARLEPDHTAVGNAVGDFPFVVADMDGQPRPARRTVGADEPSTEKLSARMLTERDVGPQADLPALEAVSTPVDSAVPTAQPPPPAKSEAAAPSAPPASP